MKPNIDRIILEYENEDRARQIVIQFEDFHCLGIEFIGKKWEIVSLNEKRIRPEHIDGEWKSCLVKRVSTESHLKIADRVLKKYLPWLEGTEKI